MKYITIEIQSYPDGTVGFLTFDYTDKAQAESKYHAVLSAAAVSALPQHAAILIDNTGKLLERQCYSHAVPQDLETEEPTEE